MVFEYGWFSDFFNVAQTAPVISFLPILLMGILFGLAMDYEVFLVSRIREEYVHAVNSKGDDPLGPPPRAQQHTGARAAAHRAIEDGFAASSRVVIAAAVIMFAVFAAFVPHGEGPIKTIAFGLAVGVFIDAFVVRMTLVPAVLALLGQAAWWLPRWIDRRLPSFDVEGEALAHQLALADWPAPGDTHAVYAEDLVIGDALVSLAVRAGEVAVVDGPDASALLLTLSGRMAIADGRVKVAGLVLPEQAAAVRRRTAYLDCAASPDINRELTSILRASPDILFVDHADFVPLATFDGVGPTVVLGLRNRELANELRPELLTASPA
jgi:RND superfamily putative drug exporter